MRIDDFGLDRSGLTGSESDLGTETVSGRVFKAVDLYSGVGGWSLGFKLAGIQTAASYEISKPACETQESNLGVKVFQADIRKALPSLPESIDIVVGSPPCTEFSFSNRGGNGDISDGLRDLERFLSVVQKVRPRYWAFENVPRVESILNDQVYKAKGRLRKFRDLFEEPGTTSRIFDMSRFGLPQRRMRCIVGKYPIQTLESYTNGIQPLPLSAVIAAFRSDDVQDPLYSVRLHRNDLTEHEFEPVLTFEERRLNRDAKRVHPIYNKMEFPDDLARPVRAITATCTRVSRESIIVPAEQSRRGLRRLTLRERASLQGFPINFQFHAKSRSKKMELIGNAIPPLFTYFLGCAILGKPAHEIVHPRELAFSPSEPKKLAPITTPTVIRSSYPITRRFRGTEPFLHFKSGVRFELANTFAKNRVRWSMRFYYGSSSDIRVFEPSVVDLRALKAFARKQKILCKTSFYLKDLSAFAQTTSGADLQLRWSRRSPGVSPYVAMRLAADAAKCLSKTLRASCADELLALVEKTIVKPDDKKRTQQRGVINQKKFERNVRAIVSGLLCAAVFNSKKISKPSEL